ncbi:MAG: NnrU family protein [Rubrivivax sp.]|jgi:uncharacterized membrane protein
MTLLVLGLLLFLGVHSVRIVAEPWRQQTLARIGPGAWKGLYSLASAVGLGLIIWGYGQARAEPVMLWTPQLWARHLGFVLTLVSFVFLAAAYVPGNHLKAAVKHPMVLGVKVWALAHLLANHTLADAVLFGSFLLWAVLDFRAARQRDRAEGTVYPAGRLVPTVITVVAGVIAWAVFAMALHRVLIGVSVMGR